MRKFAVLRLAVVFVLVMVGSSCGDDEGGGSGGGGGGSKSEDAGKAPGVTEDSIKIGVTYTDLEAIREVVDLDQGDYEATYQALFDDINANGGINGRKLEPVFVAVNPLEPKFAEAACVKLTEEEKVFVTIGFLMQDTMLCYVDEHESAVIGGTMTPERLERAKAPWFTTEPSPDLQVDAVRELNEADVFDGKFAVFATDVDEAFLHDQIEPALEEFGLESVAVEVLPESQGDQAVAAAKTKEILAKFEAAGATKVLALGQSSVFMATALGTGSYRPELLVTGGLDSVGIWISTSAGSDLSVLNGAVAADIYGGNINRFREANMQLCIGGPLKAAGIDVPEPIDGPVPPGTPDPFTSAVAACKNMALLEGLLTNVSGDLGYETFGAAANQMRDLPMPTSDRPYRYGLLAGADGDAPISLFDFDSSKNTFVRRDT